MITFLAFCGVILFFLCANGMSLMFAQTDHFKKHNDDLILEMSKMMTELEKVGMDKALDLNPISCATYFGSSVVGLDTCCISSIRCCG